jgi:NAD(P)-dependent dehydrogenase (short-subunit alcohol dehydrogenase family)
MTVGFDRRVAVVTGAGTGLGRAYALLLASHGVSVVVNDLGGTVDGTGGEHAMADQVVAEIHARGGKAVADYGSVAEESSARGIIEHAVQCFGRLDILINNAGVLRDKGFNNMDMADFEFVSEVHYMGTVYCTRAAWPIMRAQKYGRIVVTTSGSGTAGHFGQSNYGAAKMAVVGLMNCLRLEGEKYGILINAISPTAKTRMTEAFMQTELARNMRPDLVAPAVAWLSSEACNVTGEIIAAGGGGFSCIRYYQSDGVQFDPEAPVTIDMFGDALDRITDFSEMSLFRENRHQRVEQKLRAIGRLP